MLIIQKTIKTGIFDAVPEEPDAKPPEKRGLKSFYSNIVS